MSDGRAGVFTAEKTVHNVIVFYDDENKESAQYLVDKMERHDNYTAKKHRVDSEKGAYVFTVLKRSFDFGLPLHRVVRRLRVGRLSVRNEREEIFQRARRNF